MLMNRILTIFILNLGLFSGLSPSIWAQNIVSVEESTNLRDDHTKVFEVVKGQPVLDPLTLEPTGEIEEVTYQIIEKGDNLHYNAGTFERPVWINTDSAFALSESGSWESLKGRHQVSLPGELSPKSELLFRVGESYFRTVPFKVMYVERGSGKTFDIGWLKSSRAEVKGCVVAYSDAFTGISADLRYTNTRSCLKQDLLLRSLPPSPEEYGLNPHRTYFVVVTELTGLSDYVGAAVGIWGDDHPIDLGGISSAGLEASTIAFYRNAERKEFLHAFTPGIAFEGEMLKGDKAGSSIPVRKKIWQDQGKYFLWEEIPYSFLLKAALPVTIDYTNRSGNITANQIWTAGPTYYVSGTVTLGAGVTLQIDPGAIVKFSDDTYGESGIKVSGAGSKVIATGLSNNPILLTSANDDSTGEKISGSTGTPVAGDYRNAITVGWNSASTSSISYCRVLYATRGIEIAGNLSSPIQHNVFSQASETGIGSWSEETLDFKLRNNLFSDSENGITLDINHSLVQIENCTLDQCQGNALDLEGATENVSVRNNLFSRCATAFRAETIPDANHDYNAFFSNSIDRDGPSEESHSVSLSSLPFTGSSAEPYYLDQDCDLIDAGSWNSASAGLSGFFTTKYSFPRNSDGGTVDIGYHYPTFDADNDGMPDIWEQTYGLNPYSNDASVDSDNDGYTNITEYRGGSRPKTASSIPLQFPLREADFTGDGASEICVFRSYYGIWYIRGISNVQYGQNKDIPAPGDYDGNGTGDIAIWRPATGTWYVRNLTYVAYGMDGDIPVQADYDGDGTTDKAIWRPSAGYWYVYSLTRFIYGGSGDTPMSGDYNGDGTTGMAIFRPSTATWYFKNLTQLAWGASNDSPVPGDYNGDGVDDLILFSAQTCATSPALWKIKYLSGGYENVSFGGYGDIPSPGDYNGDGSTELCTFRPYCSAKNWNVRQLTIFTYGLTGDTSVPGFWLGSDSDNDRLFDDWEEFYFGNLLQKPQNDHPDYDDFINLYEYQYGTSPLLADSDGDGLNDEKEINDYQTNPLDPDSDDDELNDYQEVKVYDTDPNDPDSDGDGFNDAWEVSYGTDPTQADTDADGSSDWDEYYFWTSQGWSPQSDIDNDFVVNILDQDADGDGIPDGWEAYYWCVSAASFDSYSDPDQDGFLNSAEYLAKTDPCDDSSKPAGSPPTVYSAGCVVINELVTNPQADWNDSSSPPEGKIKFNAVPGTGTVNNEDQWIELFNTQTAASPIDLTGWALYMHDISYARYGLGDTASGAILRFSAFSCLTGFANGGCLVIGDPPGAMDKTVFLELRDAAGTLIDTVELGDDPEDDDNGDGAPDGSALGGASSGLATEAIARVPNGQDSDPDEDAAPTQADVADFVRQSASIGQANPSPSSYPVGSVVINEIVADPQSDWNDSTGGNGTAFDDSPGVGEITVSDQWVELFNADPSPVDLSGWSLEIVAGDPLSSVVQPLGSGQAVFRFTAGGDIDDFHSGEFLTIGNPTGALRNVCWLRLKDATGVIIDQVEIGDDPEEDGNGDGAPDGTARGGEATGPSDEAIFRYPDGADTDNDVADFFRGPPSIMETNFAPQTVAAGEVVINEVVTDPQADWNDSTGGDGQAFNADPGYGTINSDDQWIELYNASTSELDLSGWSLLMVDAESCYYWTEEVLGESSAALVFSEFSSLTDFQAGGYLVIGNPVGAMADRVWIELFDREGVLVDQVELGDDPRGDGNGNGAADGGSAGGLAVASSVESIARIPIGVDTDNDPADFIRQSATIGSANLPAYSSSPGSIVINEIVTSPQQDWNDSTGGNAVAFDSTPGTGQPGTDDEWIEFFNQSDGVIDLSGWYLRVWSSATEAEVETVGGSASTLVFSSGSSLPLFQPGGYLVIGDMSVSLPDRAYCEFIDPAGNVIDEVELGDDPEGDGEGDCAPGGLAEGGFSRGIPEESVSRCPNGWDEDTDPGDFVKRAATIGSANPSTLPAPLVTSISPAEGYCTGGTLVEISGYHFGSDAETIAWVGETSLSDQEVTSPYKIVGVTGWSSSTGAADVMVDVSGLQGILADGFTYLGLPSFQILTLDSDSDGLDLAEETDLGTDPDLADTDGDGIDDGAESGYWTDRGMNPSDDCDGDSIANILDADSDNDGISDGDEIAQRTDPCNDDIVAPSIQMTDPQNGQIFY